MKKYKAALLLAICILLMGCGRQSREETVQIQTDPPKVQIGLSFDSFVIERWMRDRDMFVSAAQMLGAEINVQTANGVVEEQISQIEYFIKKKMDVIVIVAIDGEALTEVVEKAKDAGIRVVSYDRLIMNSDTDLYISFDNEKVGTLMGEALKNALPQGGKIFAVYGSQSDHNVQLVSQGLEASLENSGLEIIYSAYCDNWLAELAFGAVNEGLETYGTVDGVMCGNDDLASQAIKALSEHRMAGKVAVVAQDAELSACQRIVEGTQKMTVYKPVEELARKAAEFSAALGYEKLVAEKRLTMEDVPEAVPELLEELKKLELISDQSGAGQSGSQEDGQRGEVPYYKIEPVAVTRNNIDEVIIGGGFHTEEDVYLNANRGYPLTH